MAIEAYDANCSFPLECFGDLTSANAAKTAAQFERYNAIINKLKANLDCLGIVVTATTVSSTAGVTTVLRCCFGSTWGARNINAAFSAIGYPNYFQQNWRGWVGPPPRIFGYL